MTHPPRSLHTCLPKETAFDPYRKATTSNSRLIIEESINLVEEYEKTNNLRSRRRKFSDQLNFEITIEALLCNLMLDHLSPHQSGVYITRSNKVLGKKSCDSHPALRRSLPKTLDTLGVPDLALMTMTLGFKRKWEGKKQTVIKAGSRLIKRMAELQINFGDMGVDLTKETITLKAVKEPGKRKAERIDYTDTPQTQKLGEEMIRINRWLASADIEFDPERCEVPPLEPVNIHDRFLKRIFTCGSFESGGRLYGGFWRPLDKHTRLQGTTISGEPVVELDFGQLAARVAYGIAGKTSSMADAYMLDGYEDQRKAIKRLMVAMLCTSKPFRQMPPTIQPLFGSGKSYKPVKEAILSAHVGIKNLFFTGLGHRIQWIESSIIVDVLLQL